MALSPKQRSFLKGKAHALKPVVMIGKEGLTDSVLKSLYDALRSHELVKIKVPAESQDDFKESVNAILHECQGVEKVQTIGHLLVLFRPSTPAGKISKVLREANLTYTKAQRDAHIAAEAALREAEETQEEE